MLPKDPLDCYSDWACGSCDFTLEVAIHTATDNTPACITAYTPASTTAYDALRDIAFV